MPIDTRYIVSNLDFEYEISLGDSYSPKKYMQKLSQRWYQILRLLHGYELAQPLGKGSPKTTAKEAVSVKAGTPQLQRPSATPLQKKVPLLAWGVTPKVLSLAKEYSPHQNFPAIHIVRKVNSKIYSHQLEKQLGHVLPYSQIVKDLPSLKQAILDCPFDWVLKHPFGVSGRERLVGKSGNSIENEQIWSQKQFSHGWELIFEPWLTNKREISIQYQLYPDGTIENIGQCELMTDPSGQFRGHLITPNMTFPSLLLEQTLQAAKQVAKDGYYGALGFDTMLGTLGEESFLRPITEINARVTFGRLAVELKRWLPKGWSTCWWHPPHRRLKELDFEITQVETKHFQLQNQGIYKLPEAVDPQGLSGTLLLTAPSLQALQAMLSQHI